MNFQPKKEDFYRSSPCLHLDATISEDGVEINYLNTENKEPEISDKVDYSISNSERLSIKKFGKVRVNSVDKYINKIHNSDCIELLNKLPDDSIDCVVIDPPYMNVVNEKGIDNGKLLMNMEWWEWISESKRVLKRSGSFYIFGFSYQLMKLINNFEQNGFTFKQDIVIWKGLQSW